MSRALAMIVVVLWFAALFALWLTAKIDAMFFFPFELEWLAWMWGPGLSNPVMAMLTILTAGAVVLYLRKGRPWRRLLIAAGVLAALGPTPLLALILVFKLLG